jgi:hypothetical protein
MLSSTLLVALLHIHNTAPVQAASDYHRDDNIYPWGENPNNKYRMYWKDSYNVLEDLDKFSSLYIMINGCVWSEYGLGTSYDDDGENHDGDSTWYMTRTQPFRANAAFSLYGRLRSDNSRGGKNCQQNTYINSFFTQLGADSILSAIGQYNISAFPYSSYGSEYCYEYEEDYDRDRRELSSGSGDSGAETTTMGCGEDDSFVRASFQGQNCDGGYYLNVTSQLDDYNSAMDAVGCRQVWSYDLNYNDTLYNNSDTSEAETILSTAMACDIYQYPDGLCPDSYGLKKKYATNMVFASQGTYDKVTWQWKVRLTTCGFFMVALATTIFTYWMKNRKHIKARGGGYKGYGRQMLSEMRHAIKNALKPKPKPTPNNKSPKRKKAKSSKRIITVRSSEGPPEEEADRYNPVKEVTLGEMA